MQSNTAEAAPESKPSEQFGAIFGLPIVQIVDNHRVFF
jgi:hypothetical protein